MSVSVTIPQQVGTVLRRISRAWNGQHGYDEFFEIEVGRAAFSIVVSR